MLAAADDLGDQPPQLAIEGGDLVRQPPAGNDRDGNRVRLDLERTEG